MFGWQYKQVEDHGDKENVGLEQKDNVRKQKKSTVVIAEKKKRMNRAVGKNDQKKEERIRLMEEKKLKKQVSILLATSFELADAYLVIMTD